METEIKESYTFNEWRDMDSKKATEILQAMSLLERLEVLENVPRSNNPFEWHISESKRELMQYYMNAFATCSCLGHSKGARNESLVKWYGELMQKYDIPIPPNEICWVLGNFNGKGSS
jgi:hypothetical protein